MKTAAINVPPQKVSVPILTAAFAVCFVSILFSGVTSMLMSVYLPVAVKDMLGNVSGAKFENISAYVNAIFVFGSMFGGFTWGFICDRIGRSKAVILSTVCYGLFTLLTAFSSSWVLVSAYRFFTGFGVGGVIVTTNILIAEIWPAKNRAVALGIVGVGMPIGFIFSGVMNNAFSNWHYAFLTGIIPLALALIAMVVLRESAQRQDNINQSDTSSKNIFAPEYKKELVTGSLIFGAMLIGLWAIFLWAPTWIQSIAGAENAQQLRGETMMILAGGGIVGSCVSGWLVNLAGLRKTMMLCFAVCFIMTFVVFKLNTAVTTATFIQMAVLAFFFGISQGALSVYIPLLFPAVIRASATGFCYNIGRLFTGSVVFFIGALEGLLGGYGNAVFVFSFIFIVGFAVTFFSHNQNKITN
ncbi:MAG TPA: MFS transporter [Chitinophagaceae bacterium]|nr:MFS transporter [Chitinophagaceae bacterium]